VQAQTGAWLEALDGRADGWSRNLADLHAVMDTPAELVSDMMSLVFRQRALAAGTLRAQGRPVRPGLLETALLTLEAGDDALVGQGQTHAAHALCPRVPEARRARLTLDGGQHYDLFSGPRAAREVVPALEAFYARLT
jgi:poly-beta-hydroxyalkanoate depolymerase